ncbi:MAG TPA: gamma-glutamyl-gamma-aminobutyrate hydrolase family protein [Candidatus Acidoferrum sp.]|nr:gamma-glutamyl-gamma-aminobutyrate hydrolase family protein [Candidatus Acidoferrum sp.]
MGSESAGKARVGIPYRTRKEELAAERKSYDMYVEAVRQAGGEPVEVSLGLATPELTKLARTVDAVVLPGSPADVDPAKYGAARHPKCAEADQDRERTDFALLEDAFAERKPVLAICYGIQSLNAFLGGSLIQDIPSEVATTIRHEWKGRRLGVPEPFHGVRVEQGSRLFELAQRASEIRVNSSHHQSIRQPGRCLRVTATAQDGVLEAVEWTGDGNWVTGVQWHPERMVKTDAVARALFESLVRATRKTAVPGAVSGAD